MLGHADDVQARGAFDAGVGVGKHIELAAAGTHFLHVADGLFEQAGLQVSRSVASGQCTSLFAPDRPPQMGFGPKKSTYFGCTQLGRNWSGNKKIAETLMFKGPMASLISSS